MADGRTEQGHPVRRRVTFRGNVQGVGFRYTARQVAGEVDVTGYVRNLSSGEVEVVAEGRPAEIDRFIARLAARMDGYIDGTEVEESAASGEFAQFTIRF